LLVRCGLIVFLANAAILVLQMIAGRLLSPLIGVSLATWTAVIGMFLAGISLGNWFGGRLADRSPRPVWLNGALALGGLAALAMLGVVFAPGAERLFRLLPFGLRIVALTFLTCFPPSFALSLLTPLAIKLSLPDVGRAGRVAGLIYGLGTLGSLVGAFLTSLVLLSYFSLNTIILGVAGALFLLSLVPAGRAGPAPLETDDPGGADEPASAAAPPTPPSALAGNLPLAAAIVGLTSFCSMALELSASRLLAPEVGVSLYSWTGIIGVILAAMALGNLLGGWLADRWPRTELLGLCLFLAGLSCLAILALFTPLTESEVFKEFGLIGYIVSLVAAAFFLPMLLLGTVSPQVTRLALADLGHAGRVAGRLYAWSTAGAIAGTFATGWALVALLGVHRLLALLGMMLIAVAIVAGRFDRRPLLWVPATLVAVAALCGLKGMGKLRSPYLRETNYYAIRVDDDWVDDDTDPANGRPIKVLVLDHLQHSLVAPDDPSYLGYPHERVQTELTQLTASRTARPRVLVIGGGGYTYPRWVEAHLPQVSVDVVEIDPGVTETAYHDLGLARDTRIRTYNLDGRQFIVERAAPGSYHLVIQDAVNDLSVPSHLMTREYNEAIRSILTDDGVYLLTVIDRYRSGEFLRAALATLMQTFPDVRLLADQPYWEKDGQNVYVIYASRHPFDYDELHEALVRQGADPKQTVAMGARRMRSDLEARPPPILTDQYAPVDQLLAALFRQRGVTP
jgi:predicted membrane-bound spermidine synthase